MTDVKRVRKQASVLYGLDLTGILVSLKHHIRYVTLNLIDRFSTSYFPRSECVYGKILNSLSCETINVLT